MTELLYINRHGETSVLSQDEVEDMQRGMTMGYLRRIVKHAKPNEAQYINLATCGKRSDVIRMMLGKVAEEEGRKIRAFTLDGFVGFVVVNIETAFA